MLGAVAHLEPCYRNPVLGVLLCPAEACPLLGVVSVSPVSSSGGVLSVTVQPCSGSSDCKSSARAPELASKLPMEFSSLSSSSSVSFSFH